MANLRLEADEHTNIPFGAGPSHSASTTSVRILLLWTKGGRSRRELRTQSVM